MSPAELLERMAATLRHDIAPVVGEPFPRTQAFMASVILDKLGRQLRLADAHAAADAADRAALVDDLRARLDGGDLPPGLATALSPGADLAALVAAVWAERGALGEERFEELMGRVRTTLRARLDRQLEYAA